MTKLGRQIYRNPPTISIVKHLRQNLLLLSGLLQFFYQLSLHACHIFYFSFMFFCPFSVYIHVLAFQLVYLFAGLQRRPDFIFVDGVLHV